ncbi:hypothetical protein SCLARK_00862 [Spiroplasma clarkii]|uniref:Uncharacterized protein n=1 Tax=Spiroplasma clarkii TaxID=2139 RepID=A0A1Y0L161_9MOLU|nr:hypothetical protein [Spiroplasma clarkii]ARU91475.1 hypothetical protein SCLARK_00862 [Spiroplasma clarkii]ATX70895.1 hypothetical protein SCLAR_v1c05760 [Spiroplasma clarkii]
MKNKDYENLSNALKELSIENKTLEITKEYWQELESVILNTYINKKNSKCSFENPLRNCYQIITKNCGECQKINSPIFNNDKIDDQTMLLNFEKIELEDLSKEVFAMIHCLYCDIHFPNEQLSLSNSYSCSNCQPKLYDKIITQ